SSERIAAGIEYVLSQLSDDGHVCYPLAEFLVAAEQTLETEIAKISGRIQEQKDLRIEVMDLPCEGEIKPFIWIKWLFHAEVGIARELKRLQDQPCAMRTIDTDKALEWVQDKLKIELASLQRNAVE